MTRRDSGITLVEITAGLTVLGIVAALLVPAITYSRRVEKLMRCQNHLHTLFDAQGKAPAAGPKDFGRQFWIRLTQTSPPLIDSSVLRCPFVVAPESPSCQYLGPAADISKLEPKIPIGCDMELSHSPEGTEGGNVLLRSGEVLTDHTGIWISATRLGKCRP